MLQQIRDRSSGWLAKVVIAAIVIIFALFGLQSIGRYFVPAQNQAAKVNGDVITEQEVQRETTRLAMEYPDASTQDIAKQVLDQLINQRLINQFTINQNMAIADQQLDQLIVNIPQFHDAQGNFSSQVFLTQLAQQGYSPESFKDYLRHELMARQLSIGLQLGSFATPFEVTQLTDLQNQTRTFRYHIFTAQDLTQTIHISDQQIEEYYQQHKANFMRPMQVQVDYVLLTKSELKHDIVPTEAQIETRYQQELLHAPRQYADIVLKVTPQQTLSQTQAKAVLIEKQLKQGHSFAELAKKYSEDSITAAKGGNLGIVSPGILGQSFDDAVKNLALNEVSKPIQMGDEIHLIRLTKIDYPSLAESRNKLIATLQTELVDQDYQKQAQQLEDLSFSADDLEGVAKTLKLPLRHSQWLAKNTPQTFPFNDEKVLNAVFSDQVLKQNYNSDVITLGDDKLVIRKTAQRPQVQLTLAEVHDNIKQLLLTQATQIALQAQVEKDIASLRTGAKSALKWQNAVKIDRDNKQLNGKLVEGVFNLARPRENQLFFATVTLAPDKIALVNLQKVEKEQNLAVAGKVASLVSQHEATMSINGLLKYLSEQAKIEK